jgi:putative PIN family toxin of toxin-antitoxin system
VVLDTNVALDWLVFEDARFETVSRALLAGRVRLLSDPPCHAELLEVMARRQLRFGPEQQLEAARRYEYFASMVPWRAPLPGLPLCRDPDDQIFLELAERSGAAVLISRDRELLKLDAAMRRICGVAVLDAPAAAELLGL